MTRKMATIRRIEEVKAIPNADKIVAYRVGGWLVVDSIGKYVVGDLVVYAEPDSFIPSAIAPFLTKPGHYAKTFEGVEGERLRTMKLRGQLSQGLLLKLEYRASNTDEFAYFGTNGTVEFQFNEGTDVSEALGITKYEAPVPASMAGEVKGLFPSVIPKTDQERIQNLSVEFAQWQTETLHWEVTEKLEGSSMTVYCIDGEVGVCSRNLDLKRNPDNSLWAAAIKHGLEEKLIDCGRNIAIQGELVGNGIQGNIYKMRGQDFYVYDIYDIDAGRYFTPPERVKFVNALVLPHCPVLAYAAELYDTLGITNIDQILKFAEGHSVMGDIVGPTREGLVFKCLEKDISFKVISNRYLLKGGE